jgi:hypothetical protein
MRKTAEQIADKVLANANIEHARNTVDVALPLMLGATGAGMGHIIGGHGLLGAGLGAATGFGLSRLSRLIPADPHNPTALVDKLLHSDRADMIARSKHPGAGYLAGASAAIPMGLASIATLHPDTHPLTRFLAPLGAGLAGATGGTALANRIYGANRE